MPLSPAARITANARYGLQAASTDRNSTRVALPFCGLYIGTRTRAERLLWPQHTYAGARGPLGRAPQPLVRVHPLVADGGDLGGVPQQPGDERPGRLGQLEFGASLVERVLVALEQRHVRVHARARVISERLRHERRVDTLLDRHLLHHQPE